MGQKLVENAKIEKLKSDILTDFQTLCLWKCLILQNCQSWKIDIFEDLQTLWRWSISKK